MKRNYHHIVFMCKKCESRFDLRVLPETPMRELVCKLKAVSDKECPFCGEEPYENWLLLDVIALPEGVK